MDAQLPNRKADILRAAGQLFLTRGYHPTSLAQVASAVGMLKGSLYYHIASKDELLMEILLDMIAEAKADLASTRLRATGLGLESALRSHIEYLCQHPGLAMLMQETWQLPRFRKDTIAKKLDDYEIELAKVVRQGQRSGLIVDSDARVMVRMLIALCTSPMWNGRETYSRSRISQTAAQLLFAMSSAALSAMETTPENLNSVSCIPDNVAVA